MEESNILNALIITSHEYAKFKQNQRTIKSAALLLVDTYKNLGKAVIKNNFSQTLFI